MRKSWKYFLRLWPLEARGFAIAPRFSFVSLGIIALVAFGYIVRVAAQTHQASMCLAENIYHEARGEKDRSAKYLIGLLTLARVADPAFPKTICGVVAEHNQFSWTLDYRLATDRSERQKWEESKRIARDLIENAWDRYVLPSGWACARFYKRTDGKDVSKKARRFFEARLFPVGSFGHHTAFELRHGCSDPLPTQ